MAARQNEWDAHWCEYADSAEQNPAQTYRRKLIRSLLRVGDQAARIVDIGSGQGDLARELRDESPTAEILGVEVSQAGIDISRSKVPDAIFIRRDLLEPSDPESALTAWGTHGVCSEVLEHVDRPDLLLRHALAYLAPGARIVVTVPGGPRSAFDVHIGHRRHYRRKDLRSLLQGEGLIVDSVVAAGFPFFNVYKLLVVLRGRRVITDVRSSEAGDGSRVASVLMTLFGALFRFNLISSPLGWQIVAVAHTRPEARGPT
jgi:trans-aconitate methyltransferase